MASALGADSAGVTAIAITLSGIGGLCEVGGLVLVAVGISRDRERARKLFAPKRPPKRPERSYPPPVHAQRFPGLSDSGIIRRPDQLRALAEAVSNAPATVQNNLTGTRKHFDTELDQSVDRIQTAMTSADNQLREGLRYAPARGAGRA